MSDGAPAPAADGATPDAATPETPTPTTSDVDQSAEIEKWKALSKKNEDRAKANAKAAAELDQVRQSAMSEQEKAVALARSEGLLAGRSEVASKVVDAEVKAAAKGRVADVDALLEGLDRSKFLNDEGDADVDAITKWIDRLVPAQDDEPSPFPDIGQGVRTEGLQQHALGSDGLTQALKNIVGAR